MGAGAMMLTMPSFGQHQCRRKPCSNRWLDVADKKQLADVALNTAKSGTATYTDVRIGRYLNQFVTTRENKVQNVS